MASVYRNDVDAYSRALEQYRRKVQGYNSQAQAFNDSFYRDAQGQQAGVVGGTWTQNMPGDRTGFALYTDPTNTANKFLRKPTSTTEEVAQLGAYGRGGRAVTLPNGERITFAGNRPGVAQNALFDRGYVNPTIDFNTPNGRLVLQKAQFSDAPTAPKQFDQKAPEATFADARQMNQPTLAQAETGLIGEVMRSRGLKAGAQIRRATPAPSTPPAGTTASGATVATVEAPPVDSLPPDYFAGA